MDLARIVFFGHSGDEVFAVSALDPAQLRGCRVLDCSGGPGSLTAVARQLGIEAVAVDPPEALPLEGRERRARADIAHPTRYDQGFVGQAPGLRLQRRTPS
jgi:ubiquinone/menaquinone biosynthesis C-methylase UbiE